MTEDSLIYTPQGNFIEQVAWRVGSTYFIDQRRPQPCIGVTHCLIPKDFAATQIRFLDAKNNAPYAWLPYGGCTHPDFPNPPVFHQELPA